MHFFRHLLTPLLLTSTLVCTLNGAPDPKQTPPANTPPPPAVDVYKITAPKTEALSFSYPAKIMAAQSATIKARTSGIVLKQHFKEGALVKEGDLLYTLESESYQAAYDLAKANVASLEVSVQKSGKEWERVKALFEAKASSEQERDTAYFAHESAKAALKSAQASLKMAAITLERTAIKATLSGVAGSKLVDVGMLVGEGTPLVEITGIDPLHVSFSIPESEAMRQNYAIQGGSWSKPTEGKLSLSLNNNGVAYPHKAVVDYMDSVLDPKTGTLKARATLKNPDRLLLPNQFVHVTLLGLTRNNVIKVPQKAVLQNPLGTIVFVVEEGKAVVKPVKVGESSGNDFVIHSGLKEGDTVILNNFFRIKAGAPVRVDKIINQEAK